MNAITVTDPNGVADGQDNDHGYYVSAGSTGASGSTGSILEGATCATRFGSCHQFYIKFAIGGLSISANNICSVYPEWYVGWGTSTSTFLGIKCTRFPAFGATTYYYFRNNTTDSALGYTLTDGTVYQLCMDVQYNGTNVRFEWALYSDSGARLVWGANEVASGGAPAASAEPRLFIQNVSGIGTDGQTGRYVRLFNASRWSRRAPG